LVENVKLGFAEARSSGEVFAAPQEMLMAGLKTRRQKTQAGYGVWTHDRSIKSSVLPAVWIRTDEHSTLISS
jgi:hypothetical protein